jgi:hypothetical protein
VTTKADNGVQTDFPPTSPPSDPNTPARSLNHEIDDPIQQPDKNNTSGSLGPPGFLMKPSTMTVCEGEMVEISCQLATCNEPCGMRYSGTKQISEKCNCILKLVMRT